jgi:hypothetical protein
MQPMPPPGIAGPCFFGTPADHGLGRDEQASNRRCARQRRAHYLGRIDYVSRSRILPTSHAATGISHCVGAVTQGI